MSLPEAVAKAEVTHSICKFNYRTKLRRLKKKLDEDPGSRPAGLPNPHFNKDRCGTCSSCQKDECGSCPSCLAQGPAQRTRNTASYQALRACSGGENWCSTWNPREGFIAGSFKSVTSIVSSTTGDTLRNAVNQLEEGHEEVKRSTMVLKQTVLVSQEGPWPAYPELTAERLLEKLEDQQDEVDDIKERAVAREQELRQMESLADEEEAFSVGGPWEPETPPGAPAPKQPTHPLTSSAGEVGQDINPTFSSSFAQRFRDHIESARQGVERAIAGEQGDPQVPPNTPRPGSHQESQRTGFSPPPSGLLAHNSAAMLPPALSPRGARRVLERGRNLVSRGQAVLENGLGGIQSGRVPSEEGQRVAQSAGVERRTSSATTGDKEQQAREALRRKVRKLEADITDMSSTVQQIQTSGGTSAFRLSLMEKDWGEASTQLNSIVDSYDHFLSVTNSKEVAKQLGKERDTYYLETSGRLRTLRGFLRDCYRPEPPAPVQILGPGPSQHLEKVSLPDFCGRPERFHPFKNEFMDLTRPAAYSQAVWLAQLRKKLPAEACRLIEGHTTMEEAWRELERRYGAVDMAVLSARHRLLSVKLQGASHERIEALLQALRTARTTLKAVGEEEQLFTDFATVGLLVNKLPSAAQERWHQHASRMGENKSAGQRGRVFLDWMEQEGGAAASARLQQLACEMHQVTGPTQVQGGTQGVAGKVTQSASTAAGLKSHPEAQVHSLQGLEADNNRGGGSYLQGEGYSDEQWAAMFETEAGTKIAREKTEKT